MGTHRTHVVTILWLFYIITIQSVLGDDFIKSSDRKDI